MAELLLERAADVALASEPCMVARREAYGSMTKYRIYSTMCMQCIATMYSIEKYQGVYDSGDSWMYPYQRTPMGNPYISPIYPYVVGVYGLLSPRIPI